MKHLLLAFILITMPMENAIANCDITHFRWDCDIPMHIKPTRAAQSLVYCENLRGYLTQAQFNQLTAYHRRSINMVLKVNGEYFNGPCIPAKKDPRRD